MHNFLTIVLPATVAVRNLENRRLFQSPTVKDLLRKCSASLFVLETALDMDTSCCCGFSPLHVAWSWCVTLRDPGQVTFVPVLWVLTADGVEEMVWEGALPPQALLQWTGWSNSVLRAFIRSTREGPDDFLHSFIGMQSENRKVRTVYPFYSLLCLWICLFVRNVTVMHRYTEW